MTHTWDKKQACKTAYERAQMLDFSEKVFKAAVINKVQKTKGDCLSQGRYDVNISSNRGYP